MCSRQPGKYRELSAPVADSSLHGKQKKAAEAAFSLVARLNAARLPPTNCRATTPTSGGCLFDRLCRGLLAAVLLAELLDPTRRIDDLLLAREKRVTRRTHFHLEIFAQRGARLEGIPATAGNRDFLVVGVDLVFHGIVLAVSVRLEGKNYV
jgi:hypothetical protein